MWPNLKSDVEKEVEKERLELQNILKIKKMISGSLI